MEQSDIIKDTLSRISLKSHQVYFVFDYQAKQFLFLNDAFNHIWEVSSEQVYKDISLILNSVHPDDQEYLRDHYQDILAGEKKQQVEFRIVTPSDTEKWICIIPYLIEREKGHFLIAGTAEDISVNKQYIDNILKFGAKKNSVLEILSHDLAGPLNILQSMAGIVAAKVKPFDNEELNHLTELMIESCKRNVKLIREFVANEFLESSEVVLKKERENIIPRFKQVMEEYKNSEGAIAKKFEFSYSSDPLYMALDDVKFMQVINNLFSNAIKFTPNNGTISLRIEEKDDAVLFTVADNGIGIPAVLQPVLFDKFSKARRPGLRGEESTGLGMSIIKTLVSWHGGKISFSSEENKGTTFYIVLPKE